MVMKVDVLSVSDDTVRFLIEGVDVAFINALRRTMISDMPCMAMDDLFVFDNSSVVNDEVLAHRIGFIPLTTDLDNYVLPEDCECGSDLGCEHCRVVLTLDVETENEIRTVYSGDFVSEDPNVVPVTPGIPLTKLAPGQAVKIEAYARLGTGKTHAKWQPVSMAVYQHIGEVEVDEAKCTACGECAKACPRGVVSLQAGKLKVVDVLACTLCGECVKACPVEPAAIKQGLKADAFLMIVESTGCLPPERLVTEAARILSKKLEEFSDRVERGEYHDEIEDFESAEQISGKLYSVGSSDPDEDEEEEQQE